MHFTTHIQISVSCNHNLAMKMEIEIWSLSILYNCVSRYVCVANCQRFHICVYSMLICTVLNLYRIAALVNVKETSKIQLCSEVSVSATVLVPF